MTLFQKQMSEFYERLKSEAEESFFNALSDDDAFLRWTEQHAKTEMPPIVRAGTYRRVWKWQEFCDNFLAPDDLRRPVIMRGSLGHMRGRKFGRTRRYSQEVVRRYLARLKFEGGTWRERKDMYERIYAHMKRRNHSHFVDEIESLVGAFYLQRMEAASLKRLTDQFKRLLKAPTDQQAQMAAAMFSERT